MHLEFRSRINLGITSYFVWVWNWSITLREEYGLTVCENSVLRKIFGPKSGMKEEGRKIACGTYDGEEKCIHGFDWETGRKQAIWKT